MPILSFSADFIIVDCEIDFEVSIILGIPFFSIGHALLDIEIGQMMFWLNNKQIMFNICQFMKKSKDMSMISLIKIVYKDDLVAPIEERLVINAFVEIIMNF